MCVRVKYNFKNQKLQIIAHDTFQLRWFNANKNQCLFLWKLFIRDFINCVDEKGTFIPAQCSNKFPDSESSESDDSDDSDDGFDNDLDEMEQYKLRANSVYNYKLIIIN